MFPFWILLKQKTMEVVTITGSVRCTKLQSNVTINKSTSTDAIPVTQPTLSLALK